jgi:hypothetical protein
VDGVLARRDLLGDVNRLLNAEDALLNRTFQIGLLSLLAEIGLGIDETDQPILDNQVNVCAFLDGLEYSAGCANDELGATKFRGMLA